jgi:hypothetical protein
MLVDAEPRLIGRAAPPGELASSITPGVLVVIT